ncbi:MAG: hypothetical protein EAX81_04665 [Candidatus Thorarchaeota archaeon]|nr:hypothetical protein [Candidatus Thorarchaeota archaeon]
MRETGIPIEIKAESYCLNPLLDFLRKEFSNKYARVWDFEDGTIGVFVRDKLMLRNMQTLTLTVTIEARSIWQEFIVTVIASGGREGVFRLDWLGAETAAEQWAEREVRRKLMAVDSGGRTTFRSPAERPVE